MAPELCSVVIQGPLYRALSQHRGIEACIASIRKHLPGAEIVVSTWPDEDCEGLDADVIVTSQDPGHMRDCSGSILNTNRQLVSTLAGIRASTRPYVMKFRSDHNLTSPELASIADVDQGDKCLFTSRVTITNLFLRDPAKYPMLFHLSDLVMFGRREDMLAFWEQDQYPYEVLFNKKPYLNPFGNYLGYSAIRMIPEQAYTIGWLRKYGIQIDLDHPCQISSANLQLWEKLLHSNFTVLDWKICGVDFPERFSNPAYSTGTVYRANSIERFANLSRVGHVLRRANIWANQYLLNGFRAQWWTSLASIVLYSISPALALKVKAKWKAFNGTTHPNPEKSGYI